MGVRRGGLEVVLAPGPWQDKNSMFFEFFLRKIVSAVLMHRLGRLQPRAPDFQGPHFWTKKTPNFCFALQIQKY